MDKVKKTQYTPKQKRYLKHSCGFCGERFRSIRQRTKHTKDCKEQ